MTEKTNIFLDLRGLICPEPVLRTKRSFDNLAVESVEALVDDEVNVQNLSRLAKSLKASFASQSKGDHFNVVLNRVGSALTNQHEHSGVSATPPGESKNSKVGTVIFISRDVFGEGDRDFSQQLLNLFLQSYYEGGHKPRAILMANTGVKLLQPHSQFAKVLNDFRSAGCEVLACGLCVDYYGLKADVAKEQITNMFAICEYLSAADKVLTP